MQKLIFFLRLVLLLCPLVSISFPKKDKKNAAKPADPPVVVKKRKSFDDSLAAYKKYSGLFVFYYDTTSGTLLMSIRKNQLNKEYVYFNYAENGLTSQFAFRGAFRDNKIVRIRKEGQKIEFVVPNLRFVFDTNSALSKAADANTTEGILVSQKIQAYDPEREEYLINAEELFISETVHRIKPTPPRGVPADAYFSLGTLSKTKSKIKKINNYPLNSEIRVEYVFENPYPSVSAGAEAADDRYISIVLQHSFTEVPKNSFRPRRDDPRLGYFTQYRNEMTTKEAVNYADIIHRWHLEKKDSLAAISEPKQPIVWWIEKTTPQELRGLIKDAVLAWNPAFEAAGFKNALEVYEQPDTATWDAGDIRYNVIRWTSSPNPIFGGYGPSFVDPRTGQILGSDIMLEWIFLTNRLRSQKFFDVPTANYAYQSEQVGYCNVESHLHQEQLFGHLVFSALNYDSVLLDTFVKQAIYYLVLHEVGHTLGLNHNMKASQMLCPHELNDKKKTAQVGLTASVMDYPAINFALDKSKQGDFYTWKPGPYDVWAIQYGYTVYNTPEEEEKGLQQILARSVEPALAFGNDADDMRTPGLHLDPRIQIMDLSCDPIVFMQERLKLIEQIQRQLLKKYVREGKSYQELRNAIQVLTTEQTLMANIVSRYVGGVYVDRNLPGQMTAAKPYEPVPLAKQKLAFDFIRTNIFAPNALQLPTEVIYYLQSQRRGFSQYGYNDDPKLHDRVLAIQKTVLDHWLHPNTTKRVVDTELYGNKYTLPDFFKDLTDAICLPDLPTNPNSHRRMLQIEYVNRLATIVRSETHGYDYITKANALLQLTRIQKMLQMATPTAPAAQAHIAYLKFLIEKALETKKG